VLIGAVMRPAQWRDLRYAGVLDAKLFAQLADSSWNQSASAASRPREWMLSVALARAYTMA